MSLSCSSVWAVEQGHSQPYHRSPDGTTSDQGFNGTTFSERSFVHNFKYFQKYEHFAIHLLPEGRSFLAYVFVIVLPISLLSPDWLPRTTAAFTPFPTRK